MKKIILIIFIFSICLPLLSTYDCYTIIVGRDASASGAVTLAHNEDDAGKNFFVDVHKIVNAGEKAEPLN